MEILFQGPEFTIGREFGRCGLYKTNDLEHAITKGDSTGAPLLQLLYAIEEEDMCLYHPGLREWLLRAFDGYVNPVTELSDRSVDEVIQHITLAPTK